MRSYIETETYSIRAVYNSQYNYYAVHMSNCCIGHVNKQTGFIARTYFACSVNELGIISKLALECKQQLNK